MTDENFKREVLALFAEVLTQVDAVREENLEIRELLEKIQEQ